MKKRNYPGQPTGVEWPTSVFHREPFRKGNQERIDGLSFKI
jgi:hypothetical protein